MSRHRPLAWIVGLGVAAVALVVVGGTVDTAALRVALRAAAADPLGVLTALGALASAFGLRAVAWHRVVPALSVRAAWSAMHLSFAANHLLPFRLGEAVRPLAAQRRTGLPLAELTASTITLRATDVLAMAALGLALGPRLLTETIGLLGWLLLAGVAVVGALGLRWLLGLRAAGAGLRRPGLGVAGLSVGAWALEAVVVHQVAGWAGYPLSPAEAVLVTVGAVAAQVAAVAPGGLGTYEAAATGGLVATGIDAPSALAIAVVTHGLKTAYSFAGGAVALWWPAPAVVPLRLPRPRPVRPLEPVGDGPVVLVLPARNEAGRVAEVVRRLPTRVAGRPTRCIVVDDGSTDATAAEARQAGATVVAHQPGRGLGAAVRTGLAAGVDAGASVVAFCDADGEYAPEELDRVVGPIVAGRADYVVGSRFTGRIDHMRPHRRIGNLALTRWLALTARQRLTDGQSGYRALSAAAASEAEIAHDYNYAQVLTLDLLARGFRYDEVPISYRFRSSGRSFVRPGPYLRAVVPTVYRVLRRASASAPTPPGADQPTVTSSAMPSAKWLSTTPSSVSTRVHKST